MGSAALGVLLCGSSYASFCADGEVVLLPGRPPSVEVPPPPHQHHHHHEQRLALRLRLQIHTHRSPTEGEEGRHRQAVLLHLRPPAGGWLPSRHRAFLQPRRLRWQEGDSEQRPWCPALFARTPSPTNCITRSKSRLSLRQRPRFSAKLHVRPRKTSR